MPSDSRKTILSLACLALFTFAFLGSEFYFDTVMEGFVDPSSVVMAQSYVLGSSVIGFLAFSLTRHIPKRKLLAFGAPALALICVACLMLINARINAGVVQRAGCVLFVALGMVGAGTHWATACALSETRFVARGVGFAYAGGLIIQFVFNALTENDLGAALMLCVGSIGAIALLALSWPSQPASAEKTGNGLPAQNVRTGASEASIARKALGLTVLVILLTCLFSTVDNIVTLANAAGSIDVEIWPRLLLAASAIAAGFVFDAANRRFMGPAMFCVMLLSALAVLAEDLGAGPLAGLIVFYLSSGVFVVFFTSAFLIMAPLTHAQPSPLGRHGPCGEQRLRHCRCIALARPCAIEQHRTRHGGCRSPVRSGVGAHVCLTFHARLIHGGTRRESRSSFCRRARQARRPSPRCNV